MSPRTLDDGHTSRLDLESGGATAHNIVAALSRLNRRVNMLLRSMDTTHVTRHQAGGNDQLDVAGLSGELADPQPVKDHDHTGDPGDGGVLAELGGNLLDNAVYTGSLSTSSTSYGDVHADLSLSFTVPDGAKVLLLLSYGSSTNYSSETGTVQLTKSDNTAITGEYTFADKAATNCIAFLWNPGAGATTVKARWKAQFSNYAATGKGWSLVAIAVKA